MDKAIKFPCPRCGEALEKIFFIEKEYRKGIPTGRIRRAVSHLECPVCGHREVVDDSLDGPWY